MAQPKRRRMPVTVILWAVVPEGYCVQVLKGSEIVDEESFGNSRFDSKEYLPVGDRDAVSLPNLRRMAKQTAAGFADEHRTRIVSEDEDLKHDLEELFHAREAS